LARVPSPQRLDFAALVDGVMRNNVGVDGIKLSARGAVENGQFVFDETGQSLPVDGVPSAAAPFPGWFTFDVRDWELAPRLSVPR